MSSEKRLSEYCAPRWDTVIAMGDMAARNKSGLRRHHDLKYEDAAA